MSTFDTDWDVNKYKKEFESEEQWEARKNFMLTHKFKYPESKLETLTQIFMNVEYLGTTYCKSIMDLNAQLSEEVPADYRPKKKRKIYFVNASSAKYQRTKKTPQLSQESKKQILKKKLEVPNHITGLPMNFILKNEIENNNYQSILEQSCSASKAHLSFTSTTGSVLGITVTVYINKQVIGTGMCAQEKKAKNLACMNAFENLKKNHFSFEKKCQYLEGGCIYDLQSDSVNTSSIQNDNVGLNIMKKMGWMAGSGLGQQGQGMVEPINPSLLSSRAGLGSVNDKSVNRQKFNEIFSAYSNSNDENDLVFSSDLSSAERKILHGLSSKYKLKSRSYGKGKDRKLVISKVIDFQEMLYELLIEGKSETLKYRLNKPETYKED